MSIFYLKSCPSVMMIIYLYISRKNEKKKAAIAGLYTLSALVQISELTHNAYPRMQPYSSH